MDTLLVTLAQQPLKLLGLDVGIWIQIILVAVVVWYSIETHRLRRATDRTVKEAIRARDAQYMPIVEFRILDEQYNTFSFDNVGKGVAFKVRAYIYSLKEHCIYFLPKNGWFDMLFTLDTLECKKAKPSSTRKINAKFVENFNDNEIRNDIEIIKERISEDEEREIIIAIYEDCAGNEYRTWKFKPQSKEEYIKFERVE